MRASAVTATAAAGRPLAVALAIGVLAGIALSGCAGQTDVTPTTSAATPLPLTTPAETAPVATEPLPTAVPGGETIDPQPLPPTISTTQTDWGEILDAVPPTFPMYPGATATEPTDGPASLALLTPAATDAVATWYRDMLAAQGYAVDLSAAVEDGSRILDVASDLPECRIQMAFRPTAGSTMISVLYGAGCGGLGG